MTTKVTPCRCGEGCAMADQATEAEPCWGSVSAVDEVYDEEGSDYYWVHACEGHKDQLAHVGDKYIPDTGVIDLRGNPLTRHELVSAFQRIKEGPRWPPPLTVRDILRRYLQHEPTDAEVQSVIHNLNTDG